MSEGNTQNPDVLDNLKPTETKRIVKNVVVISVAFMIEFTAYVGAGNLQSSINADASLGTTSLATVNVGFIVSNIFLPAIVMKWLGTKWTMSISFLMYMPFIAVQLWPRSFTLIPAALVVGLGAGPLWCAKCTYVSVISEVYCKISNVSADIILVRFMGLFFMIHQLSQVWGNLISSLVLSSGNNAAAVTSLNASMISVICGANFLPRVDAREALPLQPIEKIQMMTGIYTLCVAAAPIIVAVGVDSMNRYTSRRELTDKLSGLALLTVTLKLALEQNLMLLIVINVYSGMQKAFITADFTAAFISCAVGTGTVGYVTMVSGVTNAIGCVINGYLTKVTGRVPMLCAAALIHMALLTTLLTWHPQSGPLTYYLFYIITMFWGLADSLWIVQINAFHGILFPGREEGAFANLRLWESLGYIVYFFISPYLQTGTKICLLLAFLTLGFFGYITVEVGQYKLKKKLKNISKESLPAKRCDNIGFQNIN